NGSAFLWTSERSGRSQLELRGRDGGLERALTPAGFTLRKVLDLDEPARTVWVQGGGDPTQLQLFRVSLDPGHGSPEQVTDVPGLHGAVFAKNHAVSVRSLQSPKAAPSQTVMDASGATLGTLKSVTEKPRIALHVSFEIVGSRGYHAAIVRP